MKVLVTGANGFIGTAVVEALSRDRANDFEVISLLNKNSIFKCNENNENIIKVVSADISDFKNVEKFTEIGKIDAIIHTAGLAHQFGSVKKEDFWKTNVEGTKNVARLAVSLKAEHFILISSVAVYGKPFVVRKVSGTRAISETDECQPEEIYAQSKLESEKIARAVCEESGINLTILRPATVIGENDRGNVARLIKAIDKRRFVWIGNGENLKSLVYKGDVAGACLKILKNREGQTEKKTEIFNVTAEAMPMKVIVSEICRHLNKKNPRLVIPPTILNQMFRLNRNTFRIGRIDKFSGTINKWLADDVFSGDKIKRRYGFEAETSVLEAVEREVESYKRSV